MSLDITFNFSANIYKNCNDAITFRQKGAILNNISDKKDNKGKLTDKFLVLLGEGAQSNFIYTHALTRRASSQTRVYSQN